MKLRLKYKTLYFLILIFKFAIGIFTINVNKDNIKGEYDDKV